MLVQHTQVARSIVERCPEEGFCSQEGSESSCSSQSQRCVSLSSCESEYMSPADTVKRNSCS